MSQKDQILQYMRTGEAITPLQALGAFGCLRLAARVDELRRAGHGIQVEKVTLNSGKQVAQYRLVGAGRA